MGNVMFRRIRFVSHFVFPARESGCSVRRIILDQIASCGKTGSTAGKSGSAHSPIRYSGQQLTQAAADYLFLLCGLRGRVDMYFQVLDQCHAIIVGQLRAEFVARIEIAALGRIEFEWLD